MAQNLTPDQFAALLEKVFAPGAADKRALILVDAPNEAVGDSESWRDRRRIASEWLTLFQEAGGHVGFENAEILYYENTGNNNGDLPSTAYRWRGEAAAVNFQHLRDEGKAADLREELAQVQIVLAPVQFSATAPLKMLAREAGFRAASMPGFSRDMIPALGIDYELVNERVVQIKQRLDRAQAIEIVFRVEDRRLEFFVDVRHRAGHASSGLLRQPGTAANLPSGEAYIVPYEGELDEASRTSGLLPAQFGEEVVLYEVSANRAVAVTSQGDAATREAEKLRAEPAYGNISEIGFGVLEPFGIEPLGELLLDEKLGLHIAFGRSDHFGGVTSPADFHDPRNVVHIDRIYLRQLQERVQVETVTLVYASGDKEVVMKEGAYVI